MANKRRRNLAPVLAIAPFWVLILVAYLGTMLFTILMSFTNSKTLPKLEFVGLKQYQRLFTTDLWITASQNIWAFSILLILISLTVGFLLAVALDQKIRAEDTIRTIILYPYAMSFIVTGLIWQWLLNPQLGLQKAMHDLGWESFSFTWTQDPSMAIYSIIIGGVWQGSGLVMAIMLAGLRSIDQEIWKAAKIDGIPDWRVYISIVIPMMRPTIVTAVVLMSLGAVKAYDIVVALTGGGPGSSSFTPALFIMNFFFTRQNVGLGAAACTVVLVVVSVFFVPWFYYEYFREEKRGH
ncbi:carbohydrate ABC transporter permease [Oryzibacter oryziterrae]|uniref:carbohydrate ABC transporter permease n=1 Tax=Oryzibacter oryziterrae TaxID=2766474 RepID=UPI001F47DE03|nr:sugar ABC transporter permease [Oryzibacter oryziterrae]